MKYFLDNKEVTLEELNQERINWEEEEYGPYEHHVILDSILNGELRFFRYEFFEEFLL